jgi:hypothetical protein
LCGTKTDHLSHEHTSESLGVFWCTADQTQREPFRSEQVRNAA